MRCLTLIALAICRTGLAECPGIEFERLEYASAIAGAASIAAGDLDNDGDDDLAVSDAVGTIRLYFDDGNGSYDEVILESPTGGRLALVDVDGDGDLDISVGESVLANSGDGTFLDAALWPGSGGELVDLDGDGDLDVVGSTPAPTTVFVRLNEGDGTFGESMPLHDSIPFTGLCSAFVSGDVDGDGDVDVLTASRTGCNEICNPLCGAVHLHRNDGSGNFVTSGGFQLCGDCPSMVLGDLDGDDDLDLVLTAGETFVSGFPVGTTFPGSLQVRLNDGSGTFSLLTTETIDATWPIRLGDVDGDDDLDLIAAEPELTLRLNDGDGTLSIDVPLGVTPVGAFAAGELDGDGDLDIAVVTEPDIRDAVGILENDAADVGPPSFTMQIVLDVVGFESPHGVFLDDLDGDGDTDAAILNEGGIATLTNDGDGVYDTPVIVLDLEGQASSLAGGDLNGDGRSDLVIVYFTESFIPAVIVLLNDGNGGFPLPVAYAVPAGFLFIEGTAIAGDVDGDGDLDLVGALCCSDNQVWVLRNDGSGTFDDAETHPTSAVVLSIASGDVDGDGDLDVVSAHVDGIRLQLNDGDGTFTEGAMYLIGGEPRSVLTADLDDDGAVDIAAVSAVSDEVAVLLSSGNGTFADAMSYGAGASPQAMTAGDVDGDGDLELIVANGSSDELSILPNAGDGTFRPDLRVEVGNAPRAVAAGAVDAGGALDLVVANVVSEDVTVLLNGCPPSCPADIDGDGVVAVGDLVALIVAWGPCDDCPADLDESGAVDVTDLITLLTAWGACD